MDPRFVITSKLLTEHGWKAEERLSREYTAAELDAIVDFAWPWEGLHQAAMSRLRAMRRHTGSAGNDLQRFERQRPAYWRWFLSTWQKLTWRQTYSGRVTFLQRIAHLARLSRDS